MRVWIVLSALVCFISFSNCIGCASASGSDKLLPWPKRVLIVNDDGLDEPGLRALVEAFAAEGDIETFVAAPRQNQSGTSAHASIFQSRGLEATPREFVEGVTAWEVDGYPADCVLFALWGPMRDNPPDLILSGLNSGTNLGWAWAVSGTVGAARTGALMGVPSMSLSGFDDNDPEAVTRIPAWCVALARSQVAQRLQPQQFLAISFPRLPMDEIKGVRVTGHAPMDIRINLSKASGSGATERWEISGTERLEIPEYSDAGWVNRGFIAVVPSVAREGDGIAEYSMRWHDDLPGW